MAETEIRRIISIETDGSVRSLASLKAEADASAAAVNGLEKGTVAYDQAAAQAKKATQDYNYALRMNAADAKSADGSYNSLVATMGRLKQEWRATGDEAKRAELGKQIDSINTQLKQLDASVGVFGRSVGDYAQSFKGALRDVPSYAEKIKGPLKDVTDQVGLLGKQPLFGMITLLTPLVVKIVDEMKESESAMAALSKIGKAFEPVLGFFERTISQLAGYLGQIVEKVLEFTQGGLFQKIINGVVGVGNAIVNFVVAPFKGVIAAIQVFKEQGVKGLGDAARAFGAEMKQGFAFKSNYEAGQVMAETILAGARSKKNDVAQGIAQEIAQETKTELAKVTDQMLNGEDGWLAEWRAQREAQAQLDADAAALFKEQQADVAASFQDSVDEMIAGYQALEDAERQRRETMVSAEQAIESVLGSVANAWNSELQAQLQAGKISEREARRRFAWVKAFQLAQAVINTASGIMSAFSAPDNVTMVQKLASAATIAASGAASIASIAGSSIGTGAAASQAQQVTQLANAGQSAPLVQTVVPITRVGTNAEDVDTLNQLQRSQRVVLVWSDVEEFGKQAQVQAAETSW